MKELYNPTPNWPMSSGLSFTSWLFKASRNSFVPERAMVPRDSMVSSRVMPMPLSLTVSVPASLSTASFIFHPLPSSRISLFVSES